MKKILFSLVGFLIAAACAEPITMNQAETAAKAWAGNRVYTMTDDLSGKAVAGVFSYTNATGTVLFHCVNFEGGGYVVTSSDDGIYPVVAFSETGRMERDDGNPLWAMLVGDLEGRIARDEQPQLLSATLNSADANGSSSARGLWQTLLGTRKTASPDASGAVVASDVRVAPLVQSKWGQSTVGSKTVFNYYTPGNCVCGCVATAMAQLMRYHRYPTKSVTAQTYSSSVNGVAYMLKMKGGTYDWDNMPLIPTSSITEAERMAIGKLTYDCGVAVRMEYGTDASSAHTIFAVEPLKEIFGFRNAASYCKDGGVEADVLKRAICSGLDASSPVLLSIKSKSGGGHAVLADGYGYTASSTLCCHLNMGWRGDSDAWYVLPDIGTDYNYSILKGIIYNIFPKRTGEILSGRVVDRNGNGVEKAQVTIKYGTYTIMTHSKENGVYAFSVPSNTTVQITAKKGTATTMETKTATVGASVSIYGFDWKTGNYYGADKQTVGNSCGNDLTLYADVRDAWDNGDDTATGGTVIKPTLSPQTNGWHTLSIRDTNDWFRISLLAGRVYTFESTDMYGGDTYGELYASASAGSSDKLASNDDGAGNRNFRIVYTNLVSRMAYLRVRPYQASQLKFGDCYYKLKYGYENLPLSMTLSYTKQGDGVVITEAMEGISGDVVIPDTLGGYPVTGIGASAFRGAYDLTSLVVPRSVTSIGNYAFSLCSSLKEVLLQNGLQSIGVRAFGSCTSLPTIYIPDTVTSVGSDVFTGCSNLTAVSIPSSLSGSASTVKATSSTTVHVRGVSSGADPALPDPADYIKFKLKDGKSVYDGEAHTFTLTVSKPTAGQYTVAYATRSPRGPWTSQQPSFVNATDGTKVYVRITTQAGLRKVVTNTSCQVKIKSLPIRDEMVTLLDEGPYVSSGTAVTPKVSVAGGTPNLLTTSDYTVSYENNTHPGIGTVTVAGKRNFHGSVSRSFMIFGGGGGNVEASGTPSSSATGPTLAHQSYAVSTYKGFTLNQEFDVKNLSGGRISLKKVGRGRLPSGVKLKYDAKTQKLVLSGMPSRVGSFSYVCRLEERAGRTKRIGEDITFDFTVKDIANLSTTDTDYNPVAGQAVSTEVPLYADDKCVALLNITINKSNKISAKLVGGSTTTVSFRGGWSGVDNGVLYTQLTARKGETLYLLLTKEGYLNVLLTGVNGPYGSVLESAFAVRAILPNIQSYAGTYSATTDDGNSVVVKVSNRGKAMCRSTTNRSIRGSAALFMDEEGDVYFCLFKAARGVVTYAYLLALEE